MTAVRNVEEEMDEVNERLARIEQNQMHFSKQLDKVVVLLDRMVKVEEHVDTHVEKLKEMRRAIEQMEARVETLKTELNQWRTARKIFVWVVASVGTILAAFAAFGERT